jgi:hypothetical protein
MNVDCHAYFTIDSRVTWCCTCAATCVQRIARNTYITYLLVGHYRIAQRSDFGCTGITHAIDQASCSKSVAGYALWNRATSLMLSRWGSVRKSRVMEILDRHRRLLICRSGSRSGRDGQHFFLTHLSRCFTFLGQCGSSMQDE